MKILLFLVVAPLGLALASGLAVLLNRHHLSQSTVYSVATVRADLAEHPQAWLGQTVRVRGMVLDSGCLSLDAGGSIPCRDRSAYLLDRDGASVLPVAGWEADPLLAMLRQLPLAGRLVPGRRAVRWGAQAIYRVRLQAAPAAECDATPCYAALLLDAAPDGLGEG